MTAATEMASEADTAVSEKSEISEWESGEHSTCHFELHGTTPKRTEPEGM